mgnify:CR=1 FL=1
MSKTMGTMAQRLGCAEGHGVCHHTDGVKAGGEGGVGGVGWGHVIQRHGWFVTGRDTHKGNIKVRMARE